MTLHAPIAATIATAALLIACTARPAGAPGAAYRVSVDGGADNHGEIVLSFLEGGVEVTQLAAAIPKGTPENDVANRVRRALRRGMPKGEYEVDLKVGEQILVASKRRTPEYEIRLVRNTVPGTEVRVERIQNED